MFDIGRDPFTVVCLAAWPFNATDAGVGLVVLIETSLLYLC